ncbi:MAG: hypothetical protein MI717_07820 [Spirochaetales bacterium]|nr:hypothetical protein [Spirochaetales bacterium]
MIPSPMHFGKGLLLTMLWMVSTLSAQDLSIETDLNWKTGEFQLQASLPLPNTMSPSDHPRLLNQLENELTTRALTTLETLPWNRYGTLKQQGTPYFPVMESLALSLKRQWSRLSSDQTQVEAQYTMNLQEIVPSLALGTGQREVWESPMGWTAQPETSWTGLVIYVPQSLPVRGTSQLRPLQPAINARLLGDQLEVLVSPEQGDSIPSYTTLSDYLEDSTRTGRFPLRTMAREIYGSVPCDIILSEEATKTLLKSPNLLNLVQSGRWVLIFEDSLDDSRVDVNSSP